MLPFEMSEQWLNKELNENEYRNILDFVLPEKELDYHTVFSLQSQKVRPVNEANDAPFEW